MFQNRKNTVTRGKIGEELALKHLVKKGYRLLDRNWRFGHLELDLVFEKEGVIVFVEVKLRHPETLVEPHMTVNKAKQKRLIKAADAWIKEQETEKEARFDIVAILLPPGQPALIDHIENAFYAHM